VLGEQALIKYGRGWEGREFRFRRDLYSQQSTFPLVVKIISCHQCCCLNRVPASAGGKGGNVTSAGWQVTLCDPRWHVSSRSGVATLRTAIHLLLTYLLLCFDTVVWATGTVSGPLPLNERLMFMVSRINLYNNFIRSKNCHFLTTCVFTGHSVLT